MRFRLALSASALIIFLIALFSYSRPLPAQGRRTPEIVPETATEVIVGVKWGISPKQMQEVGSSLGRVRSYNATLGSYRVQLGLGMTVDRARAALSKRGDVRYVEANHIRRICATPNDASFASQYGPQRIGCRESWDTWTPQSQVVVAVVDTGCSYTHPDLVDVFYRDVNNNIIGRNTLTGVDNGADDHGHGTHVAGTVGAKINNAIGVAGVAGWNPNIPNSQSFVKIMPVKVLAANGNGSDQNVADGIVWATDHGARVINMSLGDTATSQILADACAYANAHNVVVVAAAGNNGSSNLFYPASLPNVISVAATDSGNGMASFSNYGSWVQVAAPGVSILSSTMNGSYGYSSGTSMASPHVAGEAAALIAAYPGLTNHQVSKLIRFKVATYVANGKPISPRGGLIQVDDALLAAPLGTTAPTIPTGLLAQSGSPSVYLNWNPVVGADGYTIRRSTVPGGPFTTIATNVHNEEYTDTTTALAVTYYYTVAATNPVGESQQSPSVSATTGLHFRINSAGPFYNSPTTGVWMTDAGFIGGTTSAFDNTITGTSDPQLYKDYRVSTTNFSYAFSNLPNGQYLAKLHFAELFHTVAGNRRFNVSINGTQVLTNYDIFAAAGGQNKAIVTIHPVTVTSSTASIVWTSVTGNAIVNALEFMALPVPAISTISPASAPAGAPALNMSVTGLGFAPQSKVKWNGTDLSTTYVSPTQLTAVIPSANLTAQGTRQVTVFNPGPAGGTSNSKTFTISPTALYTGMTLQRVNSILRATITVKNGGPTPVSGLSLVSAWLQNITLAGPQVNTTTVLPVALSTIPAASFTQVVVDFPGTVGAAGQLARMRISIAGPTGTTGSTFVTTLP